MVNERLKSKCKEYVRTYSTWIDNSLEGSKGDFIWCSDDDCKRAAHLAYEKGLKVTLGWTVLFTEVGKGMDDKETFIIQKMRLVLPLILHLTLKTTHMLLAVLLITKE
jgi:hypothetical protein